MPAARSASAKPGSSERGSATGVASRSSSTLSATIRPSRRAGSIAIAQGVSSRLLAIRRSPDRRRDPHRLQRAAVVDAEDVGAGADGQRDGRDRPPLALGRRQPLLPGAGEDGADEVLARERDVERQARARAARRAAAGSRGPARCSGRSRGRGRSRSAPRSTPRATARSTRPPNQALRCSTTSSYSGGGAVDPRRPLDVHQDVAAAALGDQLEHLVRAAGDVVDGGRARPPAPPARPRPRRCRRRPARPTPRQPLDRRDQRRGLLLGRHRRPGLRRDRADVEHLEARLDQLLRRRRSPAPACRCAPPRTSSRR